MPIAQRLKTETRPQHEALEAHPRLARLLADDYAVDEYGALLASFAALYAPLEAALAGDARLVEAFGYSERWKMPLLTGDLAALDRPFDALPAGALPPLPTFSHRVGALYVLEGATLGGRVILKHLQRSLGAAAPLAFYTGYGEATGPRWKEYLERLSALEMAGALDADAVVEGAARLFSALESWMTFSAGAPALPETATAS